jgi:hypothetical protein
MTGESRNRPLSVFLVITFPFVWLISRTIRKRPGPEDTS